MIAISFSSIRQINQLCTAVIRVYVLPPCLVLYSMLYFLITFFFFVPLLSLAVL